ncbi:MAG TPA: hypothetical protein VIA09_04640, partial [Nitrososphaeraceae archaeon]
MSPKKTLPLTVSSMSIGAILFVLITMFTYNNEAYGFDPVPFDEIPLVIINSDDDYEFGADYSLDFGDETQIIHDDDAELASNMKLDEDDDRLSLEVECDGNDECDASLSPEQVTVYLVDRALSDGHIPLDSYPLLELESNECGSTVEDCADFDFDIPGDIVNQRYKIVV